MPRDVHILLDYRPALRQRTGVGHYVHELATALQRLLPAESSLALFSSSWRDRLPPQPVPGAASIDRRIPVRVLNLAWHRLGWPPIERLAGRVDVAHSAHPLLMPARSAVQVVTVYDLDFLDHPERTRAEIRRDYPALAARHAARADLVVVISAYTAQLVESRLGVDRRRVVLCRPGAPPWRPRPTPSALGPILFVGTIEPRKNLPALFAAYERIATRRSDVPALLLAGRTVERSAAILRQIERHPQLAGRVRHLGYVSDEAREHLYRGASMLVMPSLDEGFGMPLVEAMTLGVPVIASNRGALPEVVGTAGTLVDPLDEVALARAIEDLLTDPARRLRCEQAGREQARQFSWRASAAALLAAYEDAVARRQSDRR